MSLPAENAVLGPIPLKPIFVERIWGADSLGPWYPKSQAGKPIGEVWLTAEECVAESGPLAGKTLKEMAREHGAAFGGEQFPLLIKLLFPREKLSVQVHPNDAEAQAMGDLRGKTECWYVLSAEPGAALAVGFREKISADEVKAAIAAKTLEDKLRYIPVKAGDMVFVDAGTVHAIGPGMVVLETQQYSDVTFRLYDYGRPRELHVDQGLAVTKTQTKAGLVEPRAMDGFVRLVASDYFVVDKFEVKGSVGLGKKGEMQLLVALGEGAYVESDGVGRVALKPGTAVLLPAEDLAYSLGSDEAVDVVRIAQG
jgi:mannose-6-phosphate isomerase